MQELTEHQHERMKELREEYHRQLELAKECSDCNEAQAGIEDGEITVFHRLVRELNDLFRLQEQLTDLIDSQLITAGSREVRHRVNAVLDSIASRLDELVNERDVLLHQLTMHGQLLALEQDFHRFTIVTLVPVLGDVDDQSPAD